MANHNEFGQRGEEFAAGYLTEAGYVVLERNWRLGRGELDIVCTDGKMLVVAEVKSRVCREEYPEELLDYKKRRNLRHLANAYVRINNINMEVRIDLLLVTGKEFKVRHIKDAVQVFE